MTDDEKGSDLSLGLSSGEFAPQKVIEQRSASAHDLRHLSFRFMQDGFAIVDANSLHVDVNPALCEMTGFSEAELIGSDPMLCYWPPEAYEEIRNTFARSLREAISDVELVFMRKNGERFPVLVNPFAISDKRGNITYFAATVKDITPQVNMQSALQESEERFRGLFENASDAIILLEGEKIFDCNERALTLFEIASRDQLLSRTAFEFFTPTQPNGLDSRALSIEKVKSSRAGGPQFFEWTHLRPDGTPFNTEVSLTTLKLGEKLFTQAIVRDITGRKKLENELKESEQRYRTLFESAGDAIMILKGNQIIDCNEQTLTLTGRSRDDILSNPTVDYFPPNQPNGQDSREFFAERVYAAQLGTPQNFEWTGLIADGSIINTEVTLTTIVIGDTRYTQSIVRDITQRKKLEEALKLSEQRYQKLFASAGDGILIMQGEQVLDCNERVLELYGISREDLFSRSNYSLSPPVQPSGQSSETFFAEKVATLSATNPQMFEWRGNKLDGTPIETEVTLTTFMLDGKPCTLSLIRDITQRKQLEKALRDSEVRYRTLFENAGDAISINKDSRTIDCNKRLPELYGLTRDEILSATLGQFFPTTQPSGQDSREYFREKVKASHSGIPQVYEWHGQKRDGTPIITEVNLTTFMLGDELYEQAIARDITQRKHMEAKLLDLNRTLEDRVVQRTNELEKACAELLDRNVQYRALAAKLTAAEEEERRRIARLLHDSCQQLLVAAKFKAEMLQSGLYGHDVSAMGQQILEILEQALADTRSLTMELAPPILYGAGFVAAMQWLAGWMEENHHLQVSVVGSLPVTPVPADVSNLLFRAVRELLFNVIKHSGVRQAQVKIVAFNQGLRVSVIDEGCGFNTDEVLQTPRSYGLFSIQQQLIALDGRLEISSAPRRGTTCTLSVPVTGPGALPAFPDLSGSTPDEGYVQQRSPGVIRILVADDHAGAREGLVQVLSLVDDFAVVGQAVDGLDAIEKAGQLRPDVILMDMTMPRLDGLAATRRITSELPGVKVIGLSMHAREEAQAGWLEAGALCYLQKSTPVEELIIAIRAAMQRIPTEAP